MKQILEELKKVGIGYRENYGGKFETEWPHNEYQLIDSNGRSESIGYSGIKHNLVDELIEAWQQVLNKYKEME